MSSVITMIPVRMASTRLPNKPLLDINGKTLIRRVYENCRSALPGDIIIAAGDKAIVEECARFGARAVLTDPDLPSGTDRIAAALAEVDPAGKKYDVVVNFQGDGINVDPRVNLPLIKMVEAGGCDVATCGMIIRDRADIANPNFVKICMGLKKGEAEARALYFTRAAAPYIRDPGRGGVNEDYYWHIGIYVFKAAALASAAKMPSGVLEDREKLEQLRWLENGMTIRVRIIDGMKLVERAPADINTPEEYEEAKRWIK
ncbi:MAG: 3-deoxy-manno-octulosonate cytidylyltransferase [Rickettsiales bacterium]|jgi:3-deoxy-manno-octulosonate cytidylyltransferase (CMP-KDO synthetase)|nr:3-deoxy-manno-octulosonate cytidylyltransferase [Rickettsiales bacterium]